LSGQTPLPLAPRPKTVIHVVPFNALGGGTTFPVSKIYDRDIAPLRPPSVSGGWSNLHNFDGIATYSYIGDRILTPSYLQLFRTGIIESVDTRIIALTEAKRTGSDSDQISIPGEWFETHLIDSVNQYFSVQASLGVIPPVVIMFTLLSVKGAAMYPATLPFDRPTIDRDHLLLSEVMAETFTADLGQLLKPVFDVIWNACGYAESPHYGSDGKRKPVRR
jgi:hypothetical protein